jgi:26S proteasome regulatory subunit N10
VPAGVSPATAIMSSPIVHMGMGGGGGSSSGGGGGSGGAGGGDNFDMYGGIDPSMDPELAMAIRVSTEEARASEEARLKASQDASAAAGGGGGEGAGSAAAPSSSSASGTLFPEVVFMYYSL